jgi:TRAP-type mannitol/chloroaromatic compound transport system substrate-binding protein
MTKAKKSLISTVSICSILVVLALVVAACAPAPGPEKPAPPEETKPPEEAEPEAPAAEVLRWKPSCWAGAGVHWRNLVNICDYVTKASGGRIVAEPTAPGALCAVEQQIEFVSTGATPAMFLYFDYWSGKVPTYAIAANALHVLYKPWQVREYLQYYSNGRVLELIRQETDKYYPNMHIVTPVTASPEHCGTASRVPIYGIEDIPGVKYRTGATADAAAWESFGASTVWFPGTECYTSLATGVVDAISYACASDYLEMGWDDVTDYWIRQPYTQDTMAYWFCVNEKEWAKLSDDLKALVSTAVEAANFYALYDAEKVDAEAWVTAEERGIEVIDWSQDDIVAYQKALLDASEALCTDAASREALQILKDFLVRYEPDVAKLAGL